MAGELVVADYQYEYNGFLFGVDTFFDVESIDGLMGYSAVRSSTEDAFGMHGGVRGRHYATSRTFTVEMNIQGSDFDEIYMELRHQVSHAFAIRSHPSNEIPFVYQVPFMEKRFINCRPTGLNWPFDRRYALKYPHLTVRFECSDPRHYHHEAKTEIASLPSPGGGLDFPLQFPLPSRLRRRFV
jgi:hypothetical protein